MKVKILNDQSYSWDYNKTPNAEVYVKGLFWYENKYYSGQHACNKLREIFDCKTIEENLVKEKIKKFTGHFSFIVHHTDFSIACVDKIRSFPVYYSTRNKVLTISNSAIKLQQTAILFEKDPGSLIEFEMAGYTLSNRTLFKNLYQLQAGECLIFSHAAQKLEMFRYFRYWVNETLNKTEKELLDDLHDVTNKVFTNMVETLEGKPVWIPLSGGLDSRLILSMLIKLKYDNIQTYTYGVSGVWEIKRAKYIAELLNVKWHYIRFVPKLTRKFFHTRNREDYYNFASGLNSVPHLPDYYALLRLKDKNLIPDNAIIINGQSGDFTSGGHLPQLLNIIENDKIPVCVLLNTIIDKHFSLWLNKKVESNLENIYTTILNLLQLSADYKLSKKEFAKYFELHECEERQSKYVVNGQRAYDWLGYEWRLPLWQDELMEFWMKVDWKVKFGQKLLMSYLKKNNFGSVFDKITLPPQYSYYPLWIKLIKPIIYISETLSNNEVDYKQKYFKYFMTYAPFYPQIRYTDFLKDSKWHRNPVSYWVKEYLNEIG